MAAPVRIAHTHVHSMRLGSGAEALVARVLAVDGAAGFGFSMNLDAGAARDMAAWDALGRERGAALAELLGGRRRDEIPMAAQAAGAWVLDPFGAGSIEQAHAAACAAQAVALLAPNAHPWEIAFCASLGAALPANDVRILLRGAASATLVAVPRGPGIGVDWSLESGFTKLGWVAPR